MKYIWVKNWRKFQVYSERNPPWIRLYRSILTDDHFHSLTDAQKGHLLCLFLLAAGTVDGCLPMSTPILTSKIGSRSRVDIKALSHFFASTPQAPCKHHATKKALIAAPEVQKKKGGEKKHRPRPKKEQQDLPGCDGGFAFARDEVLAVSVEVLGLTPTWAGSGSKQEFAALKKAWKVAKGDLAGCWKRFIADDSRSKFHADGNLPSKFLVVLDKYRIPERVQMDERKWEEHSKIETAADEAAWEEKWQTT